MYKRKNNSLSFLIETAATERRVITEAMNEYHTKTCIRFVDILEIPWNIRNDFITIQKTGRG